MMAAPRREAGVSLADRAAIVEQAMARVRALQAGWCAAGFLVSAAAGAGGQETVRLTPKYEVGRRTYVEQHSKVNRKIRSETATQPLEARTESNYGMLAEVTAADGGSASVLWTVARVLLADESPARTARFDTDGAPNPSMSGTESAARALIGKRVEMRVSREECRPNAEQVATLRAAASTAGGNDPMLATMLDELSLERFRYSWGDARQALFAWRDVRVGETWENSLRQAAADGSATIYVYRCKLDAIEARDGKSVARISFSGEIRPDEKDEAKPNAHGVSMKLDSGRFHGAALFDIGRGEFASQETVAELRATATAKDAAGKQRKIELEQAIESRTTIQPAETRAKRP